MEARRTKDANITEDQIAARAYGRFLERGGQHGHDVDDWVAAKQELEQATRTPETYDVMLVDAGLRNVEVMRLIRELTGLDLREIKKLMDAPPARLPRPKSAEEAETLRAQLESAGAKVELKSAKKK